MADKDYPVAPRGEQLAVCADVEKLGYKEIRYKGKPTKKLPRVALYFLSEHTDAEGKNISLREEFTDSFYESARLRKFIDSWRGRPAVARPDGRPDPFECEAYYKSFDLEKLIGASAILYVKHNVTPGRTYANVENVRPPEGQALAIPDWFTRKKDRASKQEQFTAASPMPEVDEEIPF